MDNQHIYTIESIKDVINTKILLNKDKMVQTIGFIGVGQIGGGVAQLAVDAGYNVVLSNSRGPETLSNWVNKLGPQSSAETREYIASNDDIKIIVLSVPLNVIPTLLPQLNMKNKIILDTSNYYQMRDSKLDILESHELTTCEYVSSFLDKSNHLIKVFNNIGSVHLIVDATKDISKQTTLPIAGDDLESKQIATKFINDLGFQTLDYGSLKDSWKSEPGTPIYGLPYFPEVPEGLEHDAAKKFFIETPGKPLTKDEAQKLIDKAEKLTPLGGNPKDFPKLWLEIIMELYGKRAQEKTAGRS